MHASNSIVPEASRKLVRAGNKSGYRCVVQDRKTGLYIATYEKTISLGSAYDTAESVAAAYLAFDIAFLNEYEESDFGWVQRNRSEGGAVVVSNLQTASRQLLKAQPALSHAKYGGGQTKVSINDAQYDTLTAGERTF